MKRFLLTTFALGMAAGVASANDQIAFKSEKEKISYAIGVNLGNNWKRQDIEVDLDALRKGLEHVLSGEKTLITEQEMQDTLREYQKTLMAKREEKRKKEAEENGEKAAAFLEENKSKEGVKVLPSGLQYKVIKEGEGESPKPNDTVKVNYRGTLIDGTEFDSSYSRNEPATFAVNRVIKGWQEGLQLMKPGAKYQFFIPPDLGYGEFGSPPKIGPNSALIFDVELLEVTPAAPPPAPQPITSDIIKVPSAEELKRGAKIETIKAEDLEKEIEKARKAEAEKKAK